VTREEVAEWRAATRAEQGLDDHVRDPALLGRLASWIAATTTDREPDVLPMTTQKGA
jgi:hypothetical protein